MQIRAFDVSEDGPLCTGPHHDWRGDFGKVHLPDSKNVFQMLLDKDTGEGVYVQALSNFHDWAHIYGTAVDDDGNLYAVGNTYGNRLYGNNFDLILPFDRPVEGEWKSYLVVLKYGTAPGTAPVFPPCLSTCSEGGEKTIAQGSCYIDNFCYDDGETGEHIVGDSCLVCDPSVSQEEFTEGCQAGATPSTPTPTAPSSPTTTADPPANSPAPVGTNNAIPSTAKEGSQSSLSSGAIGGIVAAAVLVGLLSLLMMRIGYRKKQNGDKNEVVDVQPSQGIESYA